VDATRRRLVDELYAASRKHDAAQADRLARFRNVEPETAELLGVLIRAVGARRILELGTSNGYSTIWLADAAQVTGGRVLSVDVDPGRTELAQSNLAAMGLEGLAELRIESQAALTQTVVPVGAGLRLAVRDR
jgi:predicted O-methyltransferase YrrM